MSRRWKTRREFLRDSGHIAAGAILAGASAGGLARAAEEGDAETADILNYNPAMKYRRLGKTGFMLSEVSLGGHWKNRDGGRYWGNFGDEQVPDDVAQNRTDVISKCIEVGINYLDITTPAECLAYGVSLKGRRESMYVGADNHLLCPRNPKNRSVEAQFPVVEVGSEEEHELARLTISYILENESITATVPGMTTTHEIENNVRASAERTAALTEPARERLAEATDRMWAELPPDYEWLREWEYV